MLTEADLDEVIMEAGGIRAHPDAHIRTNVGADYVIGTTAIELKSLDEEGFDKPDRQTKLAKLFAAHQPERPVVVLDPGLLPDNERRRYRNIVEQPVKGAIASAKGQLVQTRSEFQGTKGSVLWIFNNGYTALDHEALEEIAANRVRQDTSSIDGVIVSGCYYHSDGFDSYFLWPCTYVPINTRHSFPEFGALQKSFHALAERFMSALMQQTEPVGDKFEVRDLVFDVDDIRFVRPAPVMGQNSEFYVGGRPRSNSSGLDEVPPVALVVPGLKRIDHDLIAGAANEPTGPLGSWEAWQRHLGSARADASPTKPLVTIAVEGEAWLWWCHAEGVEPSLDTLHSYTLELFHEQILAVLTSASERVEGGIVPSTYVVAITQEIGQDRANDVSDLAIIRERISGDPIVRPLAENQRIYHEHAVALGAAYALAEGLDVVRWERNRRHGWA